MFWGRRTRIGHRAEAILLTVPKHLKWGCIRSADQIIIIIIIIVIIISCIMNVIYTTLVLFTVQLQHHENTPI